MQHLARNPAGTDWLLCPSHSVHNCSIEYQTTGRIQALGNPKRSTPPSEPCGTVASSVVFLAPSSLKPGEKKKSNFPPTQNDGKGHVSVFTISDKKREGTSFELNRPHADDKNRDAPFHFVMKGEVTNVCLVFQNEWLMVMHANDMSVFVQTDLADPRRTMMSPPDTQSALWKENNCYKWHIIMTE
jgi:hypothetical protein